MSMKVTVEDPEFTKTARVNSGGQIYIDKSWSDEKVRVVVERLDKDDNQSND